MMDKKSANGFQTKGSEGGVQRKQLPYSVETPYGFHLDLDFLKYVDDIEKGNTIKRVHIQRRVKGPPKFSTLPRNFSLPGHGVRPPPKDKDTTWSGTSTLGPKPKSRVTEVQQIFDFRASDGGSTSQSIRGTTGLGTGYVPPKSRDEVPAGARIVEEKSATIQSRPNLLRASSMPITLQQRKGSDSSSPDRIVGTPENGSTENVFRASPDVTERRCVPQDRAGLHQQITVALKRVRELEEQVKTIPELKAQISSLREEREKLLLQLQAQVQATSSSTPPPSSEAGTHTQPQGQRTSQEFKLTLMTQPTGGLEAPQSQPEKPVTEKEKVDMTENSRVLQKEGEINQEAMKSSPGQGKMCRMSEQGKEEITALSEESDKQKETLESPLEHAAQKLSRDIAGQELISLRAAIKDAKISSCQDDSTAERGKPERVQEDKDSVQNLQEKLMILEAKLTQATEKLERTSSLLKEQMEENKMKEEKILQLSEGMRVEVCSPEAILRPRRESIDTGTETEKIGVANQETETESPTTVDQGTDTEKICIEVCVPTVRAGSIDQGTETSKVEPHDQVTEMGAEVAAVMPPRPRANSMERSTETERVITQDQMTETAVAERVNQVTETEREAVTDHPMRPRASSVDRGTETERVDTVDRVTETEAAQRTDQQTETEAERRQDNNPTRDAGTESQERESADSQRVQEVPTVVSETVGGGEVNERIQKDGGVSESVEMKVETESPLVVTETLVEPPSVSVTVKQDEKVISSAAAETAESDTEKKPEQIKSEIKEVIPQKVVVTDTTVSPQVELDTTEKKKMKDSDVVCAKTKEVVPTDTVAVAENTAVKTTAPVRPQRGRKPSAEQLQPSPSQLQTAPVRPRRGSSETQAQQPQPQKATQSQTQVHDSPRLEAQSAPLAEPQQATSVPQVEDRTLEKRSPVVSGEEQTVSQPQTKAPSPTPASSEASTRPKSIQAQTSTTRRESKEVKAPQRGSSLSQPATQKRPTRQGSHEVQAQSQGSRRPSSETQPHKDVGEAQPLRRGSSEAAERRGSGESQTPRRGSSESPTSPAALGQVVTRLTGLLGEQWAQLGSSAGAQQTATQQESPSTQKQTAGKRTEAGKGASTKPTGKAVPAATTTGKPAGKPGPSKMSSIQSQLVSSLSVLSAFYSPGQKAASSKQQEQGLKSIMKKNGVADKQGNKGTKKNLKFVGVNGGYETTSSEESSGDEKTKIDVEEEEEDSSEPEVEKETEPQPSEKPDEAAETQGRDGDVPSEGEGAVAAEKEKESEGGLLDPVGGQGLLEEQAEGQQVDKGFIDACLYVKDRMEEVSSPDKEMRQVLVVLYQEWFRVSSQKDSQADTVRLYLRQVGLTTPTLLPYVVNLTDGNGNMALHYSVSHSNFAVVKLLLDTGLCETDNVNKAGYTPVMLAALTAADSPDDLEVAQQLLRLGDVNARSRQVLSTTSGLCKMAGQTALMLAVSHGRVAMVKLLLSCGADVNAQDREGSTALMCASEHGHIHITRLLLETGRCDTSLKDKNGQTALSVAEGASHQDIVEVLKSHASSEPPSTTDLL